MNIWFTSDTHFGHENIIKYCNRPFSSVEEMDEIIIERWNDSVNDDDLIYHLGDFTLGGAQVFDKYIKRLNGKIQILFGSHDHRWVKTRPKYCVGNIVRLEFHDKDLKYPLVIVLCHYAMRVWDRSHYGSLHLYGHSHGRLEPYPNSLDIGVDCHNFYPIHLDDVLSRLK